MAKFERSREALKKAREKIGGHLKGYLPAQHEPFWKRALAWSLLIITLGFLVFLTLFTFSVAVLSIGLPDVRDFEKLAGSQSTLIYDRDGGLLYAFHGDENRKYVPLEVMAPWLQKATIAIEDDRFYEHIGFDVPGITKGILHEIFGIGAARGGSTITQQLAKNAFLTPKRSYARKIRELILAVRLERAYSKDKILELYLNRIPYGNNANGAELAAQVYFSKAAKDLTLAESAILAGIPKAPTFFSPYGEYSHSKLEREFDADTLRKRHIQTVADLKDSEYSLGLVGRDIQLSDTTSLYLPGRVDLVLKRMNELGMITEEEAHAALGETHRIEFKRYRTNIRAPHFVFYVKQQLEDQFGKDVVENGGLKVATTIDPTLQDAAQKAVEDAVKNGRDPYGISNAALMALDTKTGQILSMVGSADYFSDEDHGSVNHVFARRQPGSSFKPIVYAKTFLNGYSPATVLYDTPTNFGAGYIPQNYEGEFWGPLPIRQALAKSRNIPAIKAYFLAGQQEELIPFAAKLGISTLDPHGDYGPPLAIGAGEVKLFDMVQAFSVFATEGMKRAPVSILKVQDRDNKILSEWHDTDVHDEEVLDPQAAYLIDNILSDPSVNLGQRLNVPGHVTAVKTGTSNKEITPTKILPSNLWTVGFTPSIATGVWVGNSDGSPMKQSADGYNVAAPIWNAYMQAALKDKPDEPFPVPKGIKHVTVSRASGKLPSPATPAEQKKEEVFASFNVPTEFDDMFIQADVNDLDGKLPSPFTPSDYIKKKVFINHHDPINFFPLWLFGIHQWVDKKTADDPAYPAFPPTEETKMFTADNAGKEPTVQIIAPSASVVLGAGFHGVEATFLAPVGFEKAEFYLGTHLQNVVRKTEGNLLRGKLRVMPFTDEGDTQITVKVYDKIGYIGHASIDVRVDKKNGVAGAPLPVGLKFEN